jgi:hypothetical protein
VAVAADFPAAVLAAVAAERSRGLPKSPELPKLKSKISPRRHPPHQANTGLAGDPGHGDTEKTRSIAKIAKIAGIAKIERQESHHGNAEKTKSDVKMN